MSVLSNKEMDLLKEWLIDMQYHDIDFQEPILPEQIISLTNFCGHMLKKDVRAFFIALEILRKYIIEVNENNVVIDDPILTTVNAVFIAIKAAGNNDIQLKCLQDLLFNITGRKYIKQTVQNEERKILAILNNNIPSRTLVDDLTILLAKLREHYGLKTTVAPLCLDVLEILYLTRDSWYHELKEMYNFRPAGQIEFFNLMRSRFYVPISVLGYVLKCSDYKNLLNVNNILEHLASKVYMNMYHINVFIVKIKEVFARNSE